MLSGSVISKHSKHLRSATQKYRYFAKVVLPGGRTQSRPFTLDGEVLPPEEDNDDDDDDDDEDFWKYSINLSHSC